MSFFDDANHIREITVAVLALIAEAGGDPQRVVDAMEPNVNVVLDGLVLHLLTVENGDIDKVKAHFVRRIVEIQGDEHP